MSSIVFLSVTLFATAEDTIRIKIESSWAGLGNPSKGVLVITGEDGKYFAGGRRLDPKSVESLLAALKEQFVGQPSLEQCGIDQAWLLANYKPALEEYTHEKIKRLSPQQVEQFKSHFANDQMAPSDSRCSSAHR